MSFGWSHPGKTGGVRACRPIALTFRLGNRGYRQRMRAALGNPPSWERRGVLPASTTGSRREGSEAALTGLFRSEGDRPASAWYDPARTDLKTMDTRTEQLRSDQREILRGVFGDGPTGTNYEDANRNLGNVLILLTEGLGYTAAQAWRVVRPNSTATDASAQVLVRRRKADHRKKYPFAINEALQEHGITMEYILGKLKAMMGARRVLWNPYQKRHMETGQPDYIVIDKAIGLLMKFVELDRKVRAELALDQVEQPMQIIHGPKFNTIAEWAEYMNGHEEQIIEDRKVARREMRLIAEGRRIIDQVGKEAAEKMKQAARDAGIEYP